jgi:hypothetical protein
MRRLVEQGFLGGKPVHLESHYAYDLDDSSYARPVLGNRHHWVRQLPGQLLHNVISHGVARLAEFLDDDLSDIVARAHQSGKLQKLRGEEVLDELRVLIKDRSGTTAFFCFSTELIRRFYQSIRLKTPPPIPYCKIVLTARIMDEIFAQICSDSGFQPATMADQTLAEAVSAAVDRRRS